MNTSNNCPELTLLREFLDGCEPTHVAGTWTRDQIEHHVNVCEACQACIERLVAGQESWEGAARQLAEIDALRSQSSSETPALRELMDHEKDRLPATVDRGSASGSASGNDLATVSFDFLQPTDAPDSRGRLGSYEVLEVVGRGGMGLVLKAYDPSLRRIVAIKVMAGHLASSPVARKRFVREARAAAAVSHDYVVAIYSVEENQEPPFLVMQFVSGKTLQERVVATGPLTVPEILRIGMQTASGLAAAHAQGLVHRDIKPANILLENGVERVKITDFGLARAVDDVGMTQTGVVAGTPQYMAPEQANGESIDVRSDLFSLGSVLYTLCTGRPPFRATTTMGLLKRICEETPRPIRELNPDIPEWLDAIIAKLLKKRPADRYQSAKEVAELLGNWLAHVQRPTSVPAPGMIVPESETKVVSEDRLQTEWPDVTSAVASQVTPPREENLGNSIDTVKAESGFFIPFSRFWRSVLGDYSSSRPFTEDPQKAFALAIASFTASGFALKEKTPSRLKMTGPGLNQIRGNVLALASEIDVTLHANTISLDARMGTLRMVDGLLLGIYAVGVIVTLVQVWPPYLIGVLTLAIFGFLITFSIVMRRREVKNAFDVLLGNSGAICPSKPIQDPAGGSLANARTFRQRLSEAFPSPVYGIMTGIWGAFMIPLMDCMSSISFVGNFWFSLAIIILGFAIPLGVILYAWRQKGLTGSWESTLLKGPPRKLWSNPVVLFFLVSSAIWIWQAPTRGTVKFDIDDRNFTVSLSRSLGNNRYATTGNYSADFYALRLVAGKYFWEVKQSSSVIERGEFELQPLGQQVIKVRSPYPIGDADIALLPGRWKFGWQMGGRGANMRSQSPASSMDFIDVVSNELRFGNAEGLERFQSLFGNAVVGNVTAGKTVPRVYSIEFPGPPKDQRGPKWIDLFVTDEGLKTKTLVAHGIFSADAARLSMLLGKAGSPRPTNWMPPDNQLKPLQIQFDRADDLTQLQGDWSVSNVEGVSKPAYLKALTLSPNPINFKITGDDLAIDRPVDIEGNRLIAGRHLLITGPQGDNKLKLDPGQIPKRIL